MEKTVQQKKNDQSAAKAWWYILAVFVGVLAALLVWFLWGLFGGSNERRIIPTVLSGLLFMAAYRETLQALWSAEKDKEKVAAEKEKESQRLMEQEAARQRVSSDLLPGSWTFTDADGRTILETNQVDEILRFIHEGKITPDTGCFEAAPSENPDNRPMPLIGSTVFLNPKIQLAFRPYSGWRSEAALVGNVIGVFSGPGLMILLWYLGAFTHRSWGMTILFDVLIFFGMLVVGAGLGALIGEVRAVRQIRRFPKVILPPDEKPLVQAVIASMATM